MTTRQQDKMTFPQLIRQFAWQYYGVLLSDLYLTLVLEGHMSLENAVRDFKTHDSGYLSVDSQVLH